MKTTTKTTIRYKTIRTDTHLGLLKAELLKANGWKIASFGFSTIQFSKEIAWHTQPIRYKSDSLKASNLAFGVLPAEPQLTTETYSQAVDNFSQESHWQGGVCVVY